MKITRLLLFLITGALLVGVAGWALQAPPAPAPQPFTCPDGDPGTYVNISTKNESVPPATLYYTVCNLDNNEVMEIRVEVDATDFALYDCLPGACIEVIVAPGRTARARDKEGDGQNNGSVAGTWQR